MLKSYKRTLSLVLALILSFGTILAIPFYAEDDGLTVSTFEELKAVLESENDKVVALSEDIVFTSEEYFPFIISVKGNNELDLNGKSLTVINSSNLFGAYDDSCLFLISEGASLTVKDSSDAENGKISYFGGIEPTPSADGSKSFEKVSSRDLFTVSSGASLSILNGGYTAGNEQLQWLNNALSISSESYEYVHCFATQVVCGTVIKALAGGSVTVYGGSFTSNGRSRGNSIPNLKGWDEEKPASTCIYGEGESTVTIYDGTFVGDNGSDVFHFTTATNAVIKSGSFTTLPVTNERTVDRMGYPAFIKGDYCGSVELPMYFVPRASRSSVYLDKDKLDTFASNNVLSSSDGKTYYIRPDSVDGAKITASGIISSYSIGSKAYLDVNYDKYFADSSNLSYRWYVITPNGSKQLLDKAESSRLDLSALASMGCKLEIGQKYSFGCIVTETFNGTQDYTLTTVCSAYELTTANRNIIAGISISPSKINDKNLYYEGTAPTFSVKSNADYTLASTEWYGLNSETPMGASPSLKENSLYRVIFELRAKGDHRFSADSRVSFLPGGDLINLVVSADGKTAYVYAWIRTACSHHTSRYIIEEQRHSKVCNTCGEVFITEAHTYSNWEIDGSDLSRGERTCTLCGHVESFCSGIEEVDGIKVISSFTIDYSRIYYANLPVNKVIKLPYPTESELIAIDSFAWRDSEGNEFTSFKFDQEYTLTVNVSLKDKENSIFSDDLNVLSPYPDSVSITLSEDKTEAQIVFTFIPLDELRSRITLPTATVGNKIISALPNTIVDDIIITWTMNGNVIGSYKILNGKVTSVKDADDDDGIDFENAKFELGQIYSVSIEWDVLDKRLVIYEGGGNLFVVTSNASEYRFVYGVQGFISAVYRMSPKSTVNRNPSVTDIDLPVPGNNTDLIGKPGSSTYTVKSISWTDSNGKKVTKFACNETYTLTVTLSMSSGFSFSSNKFAASINGIECNATVTASSAILTATYTTDHVYDFKKPSVTRPDCDSNGSVTVKCEHCEASISVEIPKTSHRTYTVNGVEPSCKNDGTITYIGCYDCSEYITDLNGKALTAEQLILPKTEHVPHSTLCSNATDHFTACEMCGELIGEKETHILTGKTSPDGKEYAVCECGYFYSGSIPSTPSSPNGSGEENLGLGNMPIDKIKAMLVTVIILLVIILIAIITIGAYLIATRNSYRSLMLEAGVMTVEEVKPIKNESENLKDKE